MRTISVLRSAASCTVPSIDIDISETEGQFLASVKALPDSGLGAIVASLSILQMIGKSIKDLRHRGMDDLSAANKTSMETAGSLNLQLRYYERTVITPVIIYPDVEGMWLSAKICVDLGISPPNYPNPIARTVNFITTNIPMLRDRLLNEFADVFDGEGPLKTMIGPPIKIQLKPGGIPFAVSGARPIPFAQRSTVKDMLDDIEAKGTIIPVTVATDWTHPLVVVNKPNGKLRIFVDLTRLNAHVKRPLHPLLSPRDAVASILSHAKFYNAKNGY